MDSKRNVSDDFDDGKEQMTGRNGAPSEYLLSLPGTRPLSARYLSATCSVFNRTNTEQVMHMCRTRTMANRCQQNRVFYSICTIFANKYRRYVVKTALAPRGLISLDAGGSVRLLRVRV